MAETVPRAADSSWRVAPYFIVDDVVATANFYRDKLGFDYERFWGEPASFCMVCREGVIIMLGQFEQSGVMRPNRIVDPDGGAWDAYLWIGNADALNAEFKAKGVKITRDIADRDYGCRDFDVEDCNGYRLCFGHRETGDIVEKTLKHEAGTVREFYAALPAPVPNAAR